jgi:ubiquinone/menaquinone biosynthesis C-methylase UbiE
MSIPGCIGLDVRSSKLRFIRGRNVPAIGASVFALPFADQSFDQIIFSQVIEHIPPKPQCMSEIRRVLKPGGTLVIGTPDYGRIFWVILEEFYNRLLPGGHCDEHETKFTMKSLRALLQQYGFRATRARYVGGGELIIKATKV